MILDSCILYKPLTWIINKVCTLVEGGQKRLNDYIQTVLCEGKRAKGRGSKKAKILRKYYMLHSSLVKYIYTAAKKDFE